MTRHTLILVSAVLCFTACKEEEEPAPRTRGDFCRDWAAAACNDEVVSVCQAADIEACIDTQEDYCETIAPERFSGARSDKCIEAVANAYSDADLTASELLTVRLLDEPCHQLSSGTRGEGQSCTMRDDCETAAGFDCVMKSDRMTGTCEVPEVVDPGEDCEADQQVCTEGFFCNGENCIAARDPGDPCMHHEECDDGYCDADGTCAEGLSIREACEEDAQCAEGICFDFGDARECTDRIVLSRGVPICDDLS